MPKIRPTYVPSLIGNPNSKIVWVGEAPGEEEEQEKEPFVGRAGDLLTDVLQANTIFREDSILTNLSKHRPDHNRFKHLLNSNELKQGLDELVQLCQRTKPNVIAALGNWPLYFLTGKCSTFRNKPAPGIGIENYRGSILPCILPGLEGMKVIATYHPSYVYRDRSKYPIFDMDIKRIKSDSLFPELNYLERRMIIDPKGPELEYWVNKIINTNFVTADLECIKHTNHILCYGFAIDPQTCICLVNKPHSYEFKDAVGRILSSGVPLIWQGGHFDEIISNNNGFAIKNYHWDTMLAQAVMWAELPKSQAYLTSIHTREPFYKDEGKEGLGDEKAWSKDVNRQRLYKYNCKDVGTDYEIFLDQIEEFKKGPKSWKSIFDFRLEEREVGVAISQEGFPVDLERRKLLKGALLYQWADFQSNLNRIVGRKVNVYSNKQMCTLLYDELGLPEQRKRNKDGKWVRTADENALFKLVAKCKEEYENKVRESAKERWLKNLLICKLTIKIRGIRKAKSSYIDPEISEDGHCRSFVKTTGAKTGRWSMAKYLDDTGLPMQTIPRDPFEIEDESVLDKLDLLLGLQEALEAK